MAFSNSATAAINDLPPEDPQRVVLEYFLQHARGRSNAKTWDQIEAHLSTTEVHLTREQFQQGILANTRSGEIFIGSNDRNPGAGYFLIETREDAEFAREFYARRIAAQQTHLSHLDELIEQEWPS